jgi:bacterioferritin (cytochrome b1)
MPEQKSNEISRDHLAELLNEDLSREYQAIIAYVVYSQVLKGAEYMDIAAQLEIHAKQELDHALILSRQIDYLGKMPVTSPKPVRTSKNARDMLRYDLDNENETIRNYRDRIPQCGGQECSPWSAFSTGACSRLAGVGRSGCAVSVSVAAALTVLPVERIACSIFFSVVANGS